MARNLVKASGGNLVKASGGNLVKDYRTPPNSSIEIVTTGTLQVHSIYGTPGYQYLNAATYTCTYDATPRWRFYSATYIAPPTFGGYAMRRITLTGNKATGWTIELGLQMDSDSGYHENPSGDGLGYYAESWWTRGAGTWQGSYTFSSNDLTPSVGSLRSYDNLTAVTAQVV